MDRVHVFDDLDRISDEWTPLFTKVDSLEKASDYINFPHEDYPDFISPTTMAIEITIEWLRERPLVERDIREIHQICMSGKEYIRVGDYRMTDVVVANTLIPPQPYLIPQMMMSIFPIGLPVKELDLINWYKKFETIHPFEDGNGRVGGVVLASVSYLTTGEYIVPKREYKPYMDLVLDRVSDIGDPLLNNPKYFDQSLSFDTRCIQYIIGKVGSSKFRQILNETEYYEEVVEYTKNGKLENIVDIINEIKDIDTCLLKNN